MKIPIGKQLRRQRNLVESFRISRSSAASRKGRGGTGQPGLVLLRSVEWCSLGTFGPCSVVQ